MTTSTPQCTHSIAVGYALWFFGFMGAHRFYFGKTLTGIIWFFTLGFFFIGWLVDLFLIPSMHRTADWEYQDGPWDYNLAWLLLAFLGVFGVHRFYMEKWITGIIYFFTFSLLGIGWLYDLCTLNEQIDELNIAATPLEDY